MPALSENITVSLRESPVSDTWFEELTAGISCLHPARLPAWNGILAEAFTQKCYTVTAEVSGRPAGVLPLVFMKSLLFGRFLIALPYLNVGGPLVAETLCEDFSEFQNFQAEVDSRLVDEAVRLADALDVRYLELRNEREIAHPALNFKRTSKVLMRLELPAEEETLWQRLSPKVRNQVRKGQRAEHEIRWGGEELVPQFYELFAHTMRDVGTPVYSRRLFERITAELGSAAEICVISDAEKRDVAAALLLHGRELTEVPSAAALRSSHANCANMFMYWELLARSIRREQRIFDFGRSSEGCNTWRFKKQWGAQPVPSVWQYYVRRGSMDDLRPDNTGYGLAIRVWKRLPVWLTKCLGPRIVRGIP